MLNSGTRLGPYEIVAPLGAGGMGEVYRARDTRLDRTVAVKVLPRAFASNSNLKQRFEREARLISQLSHPHICTMHDVGEHDGVDYLVMEYLEGENLSDRLARGPLPVEKAIRHAIEIADALDKAHRQGIVHRDLKPGNVMLTRAGAKLLDFGLAKNAAPAIDGNAPTIQKSLTEEGTIVGTVQYMAPEQLEGLNADARTDIFAFGAMLYEMLTGRRAFEGKTRTSVIAAIVEREPPPISQFQPLTPPFLERLVQNCLVKDPEERWQTAHDILLELRALEQETTSGATRVAVRRNRWREWAGWAAAAALLAVAAIALVQARSSAPKPELTRTSILPPRGMAFEFANDASGALSISPDGRFVTFLGNSDGVRRLWVRRVDQLTAQQLEGTDDATYPFWSPDGSQIAFFANRKLLRVAPTGGAVVTITEDVRDPRGGSWGANDVIVYARHWRGPLYRVSAAGGKATPLTHLDEARKETTHRYPRFLPDGEHFLYLGGSHMVEATSGENAIYVASVNGSKPAQLVVRARSNVAWADGQLLFYREGRIFAQPFDAEKHALRGEARPIAENVRYEKGFFRAVFDVSTEGTLVYQQGSSRTESQLVWFDRTGKRTGVLDEKAELFDVRISPDGQSVIVATDDPSDLWNYDARRGVRTRITSGGYSEQTPVWAPDGRSILYASDRSGLYDVLRRSLDANGRDEQVLGGKELNEYAWDWVEGYIVYEREDMAASTPSDLWVLPEKGAAYPLVQSPAIDTAARVSPDRRWVAYTSLESGRSEVYVTSFPQARAKWQVSQGGGNMPAWRSDGRELFYVNEQQFMAVPVTPGASFDAGTPVPLFTAEVKSFPPAFYDVSPDGNRLLVNVLTDEWRNEPLTIVKNWSRALAAAD